MEPICFADMQAPLFEDEDVPDLNEEADTQHGCPHGNGGGWGLNAERVQQPYPGDIRTRLT